MQSSTAIAFRALIMLIFLISVPLLAIFGRDLPEVIKGLIDGSISVQWTQQTQAVNGPASPTSSSGPLPARNPFDEAAPYRAEPIVTAPNASSGQAVSPMVPGNAAASPPGFPGTAGQPPTGPPTAAPTANNPPLPSDGGMASSQVTSTGLTVPVVPQMTPPPADWPKPGSLAPQHDTAPSRPEAFQPPPESQPIGTADSNSSSEFTDGSLNESPPAGESSDDKFRLAETKLREMGATQYKLETWGPQNDRYRFECRMAVGGNVGVNRHFEAVEDDPWRAMEEVLRQVEQWRQESTQ